MDNAIEFQLPAWLSKYVQTYTPTLNAETRMEFIIKAALHNVHQNTGGPFAAGVFAMDSGRLVGIGVNLVTTQNLSMLHAEIVALATAQRSLGTHDLAGPDMAEYELFTSAEPCAMCFGALPWSGIRRLVCAARSEDAEHIGFDEGPKSANWQGELEQRGIAVERDLYRHSAIHVFQEYAEKGGPIYNSGKNPLTTRRAPPAL